MGGATTRMRRRVLLVRDPLILVRGSDGTNKPGTNKEQYSNIVTKCMAPSLM